MYAPEPNAKAAEVALPTDWEGIGREVRARTLEIVALHFALAAEGAGEEEARTAKEIALPERRR
jgi:hypothetical protein